MRSRPVPGPRGIRVWRCCRPARDLEVPGSPCAPLHEERTRSSCTRLHRRRRGPDRCASRRAGRAPLLHGPGYPRDLPRLWEEAEWSGRRRLAEALFERIDVLGAQEVHLRPSTGSGMGRGVERGSIGCHGRGERIGTRSSHTPRHRVRVGRGNPTGLWVSGASHQVVGGVAGPSGGRTGPISRLQHANRWTQRGTSVAAISARCRANSSGVWMPWSRTAA